MRRWIGLIALSLVIGAGLAYIARPFQVEFSWGSRPGQSAVVGLAESTALAEPSAVEEQALQGARAFSKAFSAIAREVSPSIVTIYSERTVAVNHPWGNRNNPFGDLFPFFEAPDRVPQRGMGSGVIVSSDGKVLTNNHVVQGADRVKVSLSDNRTYDAKVLGADPKSDVAVVQIEASGLPAIHLGDSDAIDVGEWVLAIGNPFQLSQTVTAGIVSAKGRSSVGLADYEDFIQTDAAINPGNSGGALVNLDGELIGINTAIATRTGGYQGVGFAIPINMASKIMDSLVRTGKVIRGFMGVTIQDVDAALAETYGLDRPQGALVNQVSKGSPADEAGIEAGDLITEIDGKPVRGRDDLRLRIGETAPGTSIDLAVLRENGRQKSLRVKLGELKGDEEIAQGGDQGDSGGSVLGKVGLQVERIDRNLRQQFQIDPAVDGILVLGVEPGTPADDAMLREGDVIVEAGREPVSGVADFADRLKNVSAGKTVLLKVHRGNANLFVALRVPKS